MNKRKDLHQVESASHRQTIIGRLIFLSLVIVTGLLLIFPIQSRSTPFVSASTHDDSNGDVEFSATLSQSKLVQGTDGIFYVEVNIEPKHLLPTVSKRVPVDLVVVLDKSGSMAADNRLPYAKSAINEILSRLNVDDRFGLITFDTSPVIVSELSPVSDTFRRSEQSVVASLTPEGSTNLSGGLELARQMLASNSSNRTRKVILLSDGEANLGIIEPSALATLVRSITTSETVISTIGMGLGFNEVLMASLADYGMGNYAYLEHLASLGEILQKELDTARSVYALNSTLRLKLPKGIALVDTSSYPKEEINDAHEVRLLTGQLLANTKKKFFLTFRAPTDMPQGLDLGKFELQYTANNKSYSVSSAPHALAIDIVNADKENEAIASVNKEVFRRSWIENNLGRAQKQMSEEIRAGNAAAATATITQYESDLKKAEGKYGLHLADEKVKSTVISMKSTTYDLSSSNGGDKAEKIQRAAKDIQHQSLMNQR